MGDAGVATGAEGVANRVRVTRRASANPATRSRCSWSRRVRRSGGSILRATAASCDARRRATSPTPAMRMSHPSSSPARPAKERLARGDDGPGSARAHGAHRDRVDQRCSPEAALRRPEFNTLTRRTPNGSSTSRPDDRRRAAPS
jgi:hypothetical protein